MSMKCDADEARPRLMAAFIEEFEKDANISRSAIAAGISPRTIYLWRIQYDDFAADFKIAFEIGTNCLEDEAIRRAKDGVDEPVFYQGEIVGEVRKYSDSLMQFMLKGRRPEVFKDRVANEISGPGGGPVESVALTITTDPLQAARAYQKLINGE